MLIIGKAQFTVYIQAVRQPGKVWIYKAENSPNKGQIFKDGPKRKWLQGGGTGGNSIRNMILKLQKIKQNTEWNKSGGKEVIAQT